MQHDPVDDTDNRHGDDNTAEWRDLVRNPLTTNPTERTSPEPEDLLEEQTGYADRFRNPNDEQQ